MSERNYFIDDIPRSLFVRNNINTNERSITLVYFNLCVTFVILYMRIQPNLKL